MSDIDLYLGPTDEEYARMAALGGLVPFLRDRDGDLCHLCRLPIRFDAPAVKHVSKDSVTVFKSAPTSPSIDHIKPKSLGGKRHLTNLKLAHRWCNSRRGSEPPEAMWTARNAGDHRGIVVRELKNRGLIPASA